MTLKLKKYFFWLFWVQLTSSKNISKILVKILKFEKHFYTRPFHRHWDAGQCFWKKKKLRSLGGGGRTKKCSKKKRSFSKHTLIRKQQPWPSCPPPSSRLPATRLHFCIKSKAIFSKNINDPRRKVRLSFQFTKINVPKRKFPLTLIIIIKKKTIPQLYRHTFFWTFQYKNLDAHYWQSIVWNNKKKKATQARQNLTQLLLFLKL